MATGTRDSGKGCPNLLIINEFVTVSKGERSRILATCLSRSALAPVQTCPMSDEEPPGAGYVPVGLNSKGQSWAHEFGQRSGMGFEGESVCDAGKQTTLVLLTMPPVWLNAPGVRRKHEPEYKPEKLMEWSRRH